MYLRGLIRPTDSRSLQPQWFPEAPLRTMLAARRRRRCCGSTTRVAAARAAYLTPDVGVQRRSIRGWLELRPGERVLDVGVVLASWPPRWPGRSGRRPGRGDRRQR